MVNSDKLRGLLVENNLTYEEAAKTIGLSARQFSKRLSENDFWLSELEKLCNRLGVEIADLQKK